MDAGASVVYLKTVINATRSDGGGDVPKPLCESICNTRHWS